jgi:hypothetical protein
MVIYGAMAGMTVCDTVSSVCIARDYDSMLENVRVG